jgi:DNA repair protein RecN (Recombination protein N)
LKKYKFDNIFINNAKSKNKKNYQLGGKKRDNLNDFIINKNNNKKNKIDKNNFNNLKVELFDTGIDQVELLISPNLGEPPRPLAQIASGGEISRVMLALKSIFVSDPIQTVIFDEIDTGIGGETAIAVGKQIKSLAHNKQVFCITHLAQIASQADHHYKVEKIAQDNRTIVTAVLLQSPKALQEEISRMLSGTKTKESIKHAQELLSR